MEAGVQEILNRRPAVGLALGVVRDGRLEFFHGHGLADIASNAPITEDTVFRIGSITKLFTAIAVMQLWEQGLVDLDAPANDYLRAYKLVSAQAGWRPATLRHLLTHTAGIPEVRGVADLLQSDLTPSGGRPAHLSVRFGEPLPSLAEYYRDGLRIVVEPGSRLRLHEPRLRHPRPDRGGRERPAARAVLPRAHLRAPRHDRHRSRPLGAAGRTSGDRVCPRPERREASPAIATGPAAGPAGSTRPPATSRASPRRCWPAAPTSTAGSSSAATLATMFEPHYQPDRRIPGIGLAFFRGDVGGHRIVGHDGILPGFNSALLLAPDDGVGVIAFTNGSSGAVSWLQIELDRLLRQLLGVSDEIVRRDVPHHPEIWADLCGRYVLPPRIGDLRGRLMLSGGAEVFVGGGRLMVRLLTPVPVPFRGLPLEPDDERDPCVFRLDLSRFGMAPLRVVFSREAGGRATAAHTDLVGQPWSLVRRPDAGDRASLAEAGAGCSRLPLG